jgi:cardiolipin synthase
VNAEVASAVILVSHWLLAIGLSLRVILRRAPIGISMAWIAVMFSVPFLGAGLYLLVGEKRLGRRRAARVAAGADVLAQWQTVLRQDPAGREGIDREALALADLADRVFGYPALAGNDIELFDAAAAVFDALVADIDTATRHCHLAFYIWYDAGRVGDVVKALERAARRGVSCRAIGDALGSKAFLHGDAIVRLRAAGVEFQVALPTGPVRSLFARADLRNHRKIVVIDGRVAYVGSQNLVDPRFFMQGAGAGEWIDAMVRLTGPTVQALDTVFEHDWSIESGHGFVAPAAEGSISGLSNGPVIQIAPSGPGAQPQALQQLLLTAIYAARRELIVTTPYFVPDESILLALCSAAQRGVDVTLIVPAHNDSRLVRYASAAHFDDLLAAGVRVELFNGGLLHTKSMTIDGATSVFGSVNLDMRSLWLNFEISLLVYDIGFTGRLRALQQRYLGDSERVDAARWRQRPRWRRLLEDTIRLLGPVL